MEFKNILNNGAKLFGGLLLTYQLGCSSSEAIREKTNVESSEEKKELKLKPYHLRGDLEYLVTDLNTGDVQKGIPIAYGPIKAIEKGAIIQIDRIHYLKPIFLVLIIWKI